MWGVQGLGFGAALLELTTPVRIKAEPEGMVGDPSTPLGTLMLWGTQPRPLIGTVRVAVPAVASQMLDDGAVRSTLAFSCEGH